MNDWVFATPSNKDGIIIGNRFPTSGRTRKEGGGEYYSGIDMFILAVIHEEAHIDQIYRADSLLPTNGSDSFRYGWSWSFSGKIGFTHNHWKPGPDGAWGEKNQDDDANEVMDDAAPVPPFEPGHGDDEILHHSFFQDWPIDWDLPEQVDEQHPIESEAIIASESALDEHDYAHKDWGDPGKQHATINQWDD